MGKLGADVASGISRVFGSTLSDARKKVNDPEFNAGREDREKSLFDFSDEPPPEQALPPSEPDPDTTGPILKELSDDVRDVDAPPPAPGTPERFKQADPYEGYINVSEKDAATSIDAPANREELLDGGLTDFNEGRIIDDAGSTKAGAAAASQAIDQAIDQVASRSATLGATQSRLSFAEDNLSSSIANTKAAAATISAANIPEQSTELAQSQAQAKVGTEALAQANKRPGQLVNLLT